MKECPHCHRSFLPHVAEVHIPKCENARNRPKPPPTKAELEEKAAKRKLTLKSPRKSISK